MSRPTGPIPGKLSLRTRLLLGGLVLLIVVLLALFYEVESLRHFFRIVIARILWS